MPSENKQVTTSAQSCGEPITVTGALTGTIGNLASYNIGNPVQQSLTYTAPSINYFQTVSSPATPLTFSNLSTDYRLSKEGEIYIDSSTNDCFIYLTEYGGWLRCDIQKIKKSFNNKGEQINTVKVSFDFSVANLKKYYQLRTVLTEKYSKSKIVIYDFASSSTITSAYSTYVQPSYILSTPLAGTAIDCTAGYITTDISTVIGTNYVNFNNAQTSCLA